jgi:hypothetical protein
MTRRSVEQLIADLQRRAVGLSAGRAVASGPTGPCQWAQVPSAWARLCRCSAVHNAET